MYKYPVGAEVRPGPITQPGVCIQLRTAAGQPATPGSAGQSGSQSWVRRSILQLQLCYLLLFVFGLLVIVVLRVVCLFALSTAAPTLLLPDFWRQGRIKYTSPAPTQVRA